MKKTYHFMAGLPRSGSTVLAALLNQHPDIYASPQTDLLEMIYQLESGIPMYESHRAGLLHEGYSSVLGNITNNFYSHIDKPIIIDKNRGWGTPYNFNNVSPYVNPDGKVILTMRPILEVLASFVKISKKSEKTTGNLNYFNQELWVSGYRSESDAVVENLMKSNGMIDKNIYSISNLVKNHSGRVHVVWYQSLIDNPQITMDGIYEFLEVPKKQNNFNKIIEVDKHDDLSGYGMLGLHDIGKKLSGPKTNPKDYLSDYVIQKYGNALDFLGL